MYDFKDKVGIYSCAIDNNNMIYSIDMLRLKTYITYREYNDLDFYMRTYFKDKIKRFWISDRIQCFKYNWNIEIEEGISFWFGFCHNNEQKLPERLEPRYNLTVEFNPNKVNRNSILMHILNMAGKWSIVRYDLAIDIHVSIMDIIFDKSGKRKYKIVSNGYDDRTIYIGTEGDKFVKLYNKKKESNLNITGDLTRVEITRDVNDFFVGDMILWKYDNFFPDLYLNHYIYSLSDYEKQEKDKTLYAILFAIQNGYSMNDLTRQYRKRIKELLEGGYKIRFSDKVANQALRKTIFYYFINNKLVIFK